MHMCGIITLANSNRDVNKAIDSIKHRGKDGYKIDSFENIHFAHLLHAMIGNHPQPLKSNKFTFLTNCEVYNYKELNNKYGYETENDAQTLFQILQSTNDLENALKELDGVYAFSLYNSQLKKQFIARDILGVKPLWYYYDPTSGEFCTASEKKALISMGIKSQKIRELNPRTMLIYDVAEKKLRVIKKEFFKTNSFDGKNTEELLIKAIKKRADKNHKIGLLLSGGVDSSYIAEVLLRNKIPFTGYVAGMTGEGLLPSEDVEVADEYAKKRGINLKKVIADINEIPEELTTLLPLIEDNNATKVSVALPFYLCAKAAKKDGITLMLSGLGSEELFAGYSRHDKSSDLNKECIAGLRKLYERDLYRDDVICMSQQIELRLPFLDTELVAHALTIPATEKIVDGMRKYNFRKIASKYLPEEIAFRAKKAAQYGSNFDKGLRKLAKRSGKNKSQYIKQFYDTGNVRLASLMSTGKDSALATQVMIEQNYDLKCFVTMQSKNQDSYMYHGPNVDLAKQISLSSGIPLILQETKGEKENELAELSKALSVAIEKYDIEGIITGAIFSEYQRDRIEIICEELGLKVFSPLWHTDQSKILELLEKKNIKWCIVKIAAYGIDHKHLGKPVDEKIINYLETLKRDYLFNVAGEGGEYESLVLKAPFMKKEIKIEKSEIKTINENEAYIDIKQVELI